MKIVYFQRKRRLGFHSIELLFNEIRKNLPADINYSVKEFSVHGIGFFNRLYIVIEAFFNQGQINHITGDIHFIALFLRKGSIVLTIHDLGFISSDKNFIELFLLKMFWIKLPVKRSTIVTVVSNETKRELLKFVHPKHASKIKVIYNPIQSFYSPSPKSFNSIEPTILQIGTKYNKNLSRLIKALSPIKCKLDIVGSLSEEILVELELHKINFTSSQDVSNEEILNKYKNCDIVSFVSIAEGFGLPILEANAIGRVVITSSVSCMPEIAGDSAHFVDPYNVASIANGFLEIINNDSYRQELIINGFKNINRFKTDDIVAQYVEQYKLLYDQKSQLS